MPGHQHRKQPPRSAQVSSEPAKPATTAEPVPVAHNEPMPAPPIEPSAISPVTPKSETDELSAELQVLLRDQVDQRVEKRIAEAQKWFDCTVGWALKIVVVAAALFGAALAFVGIRTSADIAKTIAETKQNFATQMEAELAKQTKELRETIIKRADEKMKDVKPDILYQSNLDEFYERALVASYLSQMRTEDKEARFGSRVELTDADWDHVVKGLRRPDIASQRFEDLWRIVTHGRKRQREVNELAKQLLTQALVKKSEEGDTQVLLVIRGLQRNDVRDAIGPILELAKDKDRSVQIRGAALQYLAEFGSEKLLTELEALEPTFEESDKPGLWNCIARWKPEYEPVKKWLDDLEKRIANAEIDELMTLWDLLSSLTKQLSTSLRFERRSQTQQELLDRRKLLARRIILMFMNTRVSVFYHRDDFFGRGERTLQLRLRNTSYVIEPEQLMNPERFQVFGTIAEDFLKKRQIKQLNHLLSLICIRSDNSARESQHFVTGLSIDLDDKAQLFVTRGKLERAEAMAGNVLLLPGVNETPIVLWRDQIGVVNSQPLQRVEDFDDVHVYQQALVPLNFEEFE